jgi:cyclopropane fatty-acyl-phospholipid synthase-like methyltransferase
VDVEPAQLDRLNERLTAARLDNVVPVLCAQDDPRVPRGFADWIVILDTYHHLEDRVAYLTRLAGALAPGGRVVNIDFKEGDLPVGPPADHKLPRAVMLAEFEKAGYAVSAEVTEFKHHDFVVFERR